MKYVKLGENASTFNDPSSGFSISNHQVKPIKQKQKISRRFKKALKTGHLQYATEKQYNKYLKKLANSGNQLKEVDDVEEDKSKKSLYEQKLSKKELKKVKNEDMIEDIISNSDIDESDLEGFVKDDLMDVINSGYVLPEEEDDEEDEDDSE